MKVPKRFLYFFAAALWAIPSFLLYRRGIINLIDSSYFWLRIAIGLVAGVGFFIFLFKRITARYIERIKNLAGQQHPFYQFMPLRTYTIMASMIGLSIVLRYFNVVPTDYYSVFLITMATPLFISTIKFLLNGLHNSTNVSTKLKTNSKG